MKKPLTRRNTGLRPSVFADDLFNNMFRELSVDGLIDDIFGSSSHARANVSITATGSAVEIEAPGMSKADFKIEVENGTLKVSAHAEKKGTNTLVREFMSRSFSRSFTLPDGVRSSDIKASYDAGILRIDITHSTPEKHDPVTIDIT